MIISPSIAVNNFNSFYDRSLTMQEWVIKEFKNVAGKYIGMKQGTEDIILSAYKDIVNAAIFYGAPETIRNIRFQTYYRQCNSLYIDFYTAEDEDLWLKWLREPLYKGVTIFINERYGDRVERPGPHTQNYFVVSSTPIFAAYSKYGTCYSHDELDVIQMAKRLIDENSY